MKRIILTACLVACSVSSAWAAPTAVRQTTFTTPYAQPADPSYPIGHGQQPYRWGWFGAEHYPAAPTMHRDYTRGWREWHSRW